MTKGRYNITVSGSSNLEKGGNGNSEAEFENLECVKSCLSPAFLRSLSFHDRPRSSRVPTDKGFRCTRYKPLVSSSLEIPSNLLLPSERKSQSSKYHLSESVGVDSEAGGITQTPIFDATQSVAYQDQLLVADNWLEERNTRLNVESEKILEKTISILSAIDKDISESFTDLTKSESIALESVIEIYRNKSATGCFGISEFGLSTKTSSPAATENKQPPVPQRSKNVQTYSTPRRQKDLQAEFPRQNVKSRQSVSPRQNPDNFQTSSPQGSRKHLHSQSFRESPKNPQSQESPKHLQSQLAQQSPKNLQSQSAQQSPKNLQSQESPKHLQSQSAQESPKNLQSQSVQESPKNLQSQSAQESPKNLQSQSAQQSPKHLQSKVIPYSPKNLLIRSTQQTLTDLQYLSSNTQSLTKPDSDNLRPSEKSPENVLSSPKMNAPDNSTGAKSLAEFDLPTDHEQFVKIMGALQSRCLEYREMVKDIAVSALEECISFSEFSSSRIRYLRQQFESQKRNFRDFKDLCCKTVVFGPDSRPIDEKVTEVIQSFYLKLLQEENETFMARLEFGLKMGEIYAKMLKYETDSKKIVTTLEKEILYLKKISIGFKV